jgi:hypothetical protein
MVTATPPHHISDLYGSEVQFAVLGYDAVWTYKSLALREEHRLRAFGNSVKTRLFGPTGEEATGGWRK